MPPPVLAATSVCFTDVSCELFVSTLTVYCVCACAGGLVLACASGHVLHGTCKPLGGYSNWKVLATLPAAVSCMCSTDAAVAPVSVQRS
jgi:hypothetical protein